jgi:uncharacterized protein (UPF0264 family)
MELLVSVRSAAEVEAALAGGADIIDAKEPTRGSLGPVSAEVLTGLVAQIPDEHPLSIVLGDLVNPEQVVATIRSLRLPLRTAPVYLKLGSAAVRAAKQIEALLTCAVTASRAHPACPLVVAVAYADATRAGTVLPDSVRVMAQRAGTAGILLDTQIKDGLGLLRWIAPRALARWVTSARAAGLITALAGGLGLEDLEAVAAAGPDVVGVRGAACEGGREGRISAARVRGLRRRLLGAASVSVQGREIS